MPRSTITGLQQVAVWPPVDPLNALFAMHNVGTDFAEHVPLAFLMSLFSPGSTIYRGNWNDTDVYLKGNIVSHNEGLWWYSVDLPGDHTEPTVSDGLPWISLTGADGEEGPPGEDGGEYDDTAILARLDTLEGQTSDFDPRIAALEAAVSALEGRCDDIEAQASGMQAQLDDHDSRIAALESP